MLKERLPRRRIEYLSGEFHLWGGVLSSSMFIAAMLICIGPVTSQPAASSASTSRPFWANWINLTHFKLIRLVLLKLLEWIQLDFGFNWWNEVEVAVIIKKTEIPLLICIGVTSHLNNRPFNHSTFNDNTREEGGEVAKIKKIMIKRLFKLDWMVEISVGRQGYLNEPQKVI